MKGIALRQVESAAAMGDLNDPTEQRLFRGAFMLGACNVALMIREALIEAGTAATADAMLLGVVAVIQDVLSEQPDPRSRPS